ncbi:MAG: ABC transporter substrate-binding protein [Candidatus Hodarchaeota archaeon]
MEKRMTKQLVLVCILLGAMLFFNTNKTTDTNASTAAFTEEIDIGFIVPITGPLGAYGPGMIQGAELAEWVIANKWSEADRVAKLNNQTVDIIVADTETDPTKVPAIVTDLITNDGCEVIIGAAASSCTLAADGVTDPMEVILISYASTSPAISTDAGDYTYRVVPMDKLQGDALAALAYEQGYRNAAMIYLDNSYGLGFATVFNETFIALGGTVELDLPYIETAPSFDTELTAIKTAADAGTIDVIMDVSYADDGAVIFTEAALAGITTPWVCAEGIADAAIFGVATGVGDAMTGMIGTKPYSPTESAKYVEFLGYFQEKFGADATPGIYGDYAYDAVMLAVDAIVEAGSYDGPAIKTALDTVNVNWIGATGNKTFDQYGDVGGSYILWEVTEDPTGTCWEFTQFGMWTTGSGVEITVEDPVFTGECGEETTTTPTDTETSTTEEDGPGFEVYIVLIALVASIPLITRRKWR